MNRDQAQDSYRCVQCDNDFQWGTGDAFTCNVCGTHYPSIAGIKVLTSDPDELLAAHADLITNKIRELENKKEQSLKRGMEESQPNRDLSLLTSGYDRLLANLKLIEGEMAPVRRYLVSRRYKKTFFSDFAGVGWPASEMLQYFYRDWHDTDEAKFLANLFSGPIRQYCESAKGAAAVLGSGAGGLLYDIAEFFPAVFGVEMAIDTQLLAKRIMEGRETTLHFNLPTDEFPKVQKSVKLQVPERESSGINLIAASVNQLPFPSASLSCVTTQYLLDIVPNHDAVAAELHRVLAPGGIWINFGIAINHLDLSTFIKQAGFDVLDLSVYQHRHLDLSGLSELAPATLQSPVLFVARKNLSRNYERSSYFAQYFAKKEDLIWSKVPRLAVGVSINHERRFSDNTMSERKTILIEHASRPVSFNVTDQTVMLAEWFLGKIDGKRSLRGIMSLLRADYGDIVQEIELLKFFKSLRESSVIKFNE